jgi:hypothetical protein
MQWNGLRRGLPLIWSKKSLVVEVEFDTDPNNPQCRRNVLDAIKDTARGVLENDTTMIVSDLKIVPKLTG